MQPSLDLAARLLRLEQQLQAYRKLHSEELAELWRALDEYKRDFAAALPDEQASDLVSVKTTSDEYEAQEDKEEEKT
jgi:hypothetical protein